MSLSRRDLDIARERGQLSAADHRRLVNEDRYAHAAFPKPTTTKADRKGGGAHSVRRGKNAERELAKRLEVETGEKVRRIPQSGANREIGAGDLFGAAFLPGHALAGQSWECKNAATIKFREWWEQCKEQAESEGKIPVLAIRLEGGEWVVTVPINEWVARR